MESMNWPKKNNEKIEIAVVGGGISGITAAYRLRDQNTQLFELSDRLGGTSAAQEFQGIQIAQGAHYDLEYPEYYGEDVLKLLEELEITEYLSWKKQWGFKDQQHMIPYFRRQQCFDNGKLRKDVIPEGILKDQFTQLMISYEGKMPLPTRLIDEEYQSLNEISFKDFLTSQIHPANDFFRFIDYHMYDDYGGNSSQVSAIAGLVYFACRPYYTKSVDLFSPPNGNFYFADKMLRHVSSDKIKTSHLVKSINKTGSEYELEVLDLKQKEVLLIKSEQLIYAGNKHALKYIYPDQANIFANNYAPWMIVNLLTDQQPKEYGFWQNEYLGENPQFLGFIDSSVQAQSKLNGKRVLTGYYCLDEKDREYLTTIEANKEGIVAETKGYMENMLNQKIDVDVALINVMGHAMPIPKPGYLFKDVNNSEQANMIYAGVDNGRLPLIYEALDSGVMATKII